MADNGQYVKDLSSGKIYNEDPSNAQALVNQGSHALASPDEVKNILMRKAVDNIPGYAQAVGESALDMSTLGGSRYLQKNLLPETLENSNLLQDVHPSAKYVGGGLGILAGPGEALGALGKGAGIAADAMGAEKLGAGLVKGGEALSTSKILNPLKGVESVAGGAAEAMAPGAQAFADGLANQTTSPIINKILANVPGSAVKGSIVGGAIGAGDAVSEQSLGDTDLNGQKIFSSAIGGALTNGVLMTGLSAAGDIIPGIASKVSNKLSSTVLDNDTAFNAYSKVVSKLSGATEEELSNLRNLYQDYQNGASSNLKDPGKFNQVTDQLQGVLGDGSQVSRNDTGKIIADGFSQKARELGQGFEEKYGPLRDEYSKVDLPEGYGEKLFTTLRKDTIAGSDTRNILDRYEEAFQNIKNADDIKSLRTEIRSTIGSTNQYSAMDVLSSLKDAETKSVLDAARTLGDKSAVTEAQNLVDQLQKVDSDYSQYKSQIQDAAKVLGLGKVSGFSQFVDKISNAEPSKLVGKLFNKNGVDSLTFIKETFPKEFEAFSSLFKSEIAQNATSIEGAFNPKKALTKLNSYPPEIKQLVFGTDGAKAIESAHSDFSKISEKAAEEKALALHNAKLMSPEAQSNTYKTAFGLVGSAIGHAPTGYLLGSVADTLSSKQAAVKAYVRIEEMLKKVDDKIGKLSSAVFSKGIDAAEKVAPLITKEKLDHDRMSKNIEEWGNNPEKLVDYLSGSLKNLTQHAPSTSQSVQATTYRAIDFLRQKLPNVPTAKPLSGQQKVSEADSSKFLRYYNTVQDPFSVYQEINKGTLNSAHIETLNAVYPDLYTSMKSTMLENLIDNKKKKEEEAIPHSKKLAISMFLGEDLINGLSQPALAANFANWSNPNSSADQQGQGPVSKGNQSKISEIKLAQASLPSTQSQTSLS